MSGAKAAPREIYIIVLAKLEGLKLPPCVERGLSFGALLNLVEYRGLLLSSRMFPICSTSGQVSTTL
jgi:hypothetical protein